MKNILKIPSTSSGLRKEISFLKRIADKFNCEVYIVGGAVRDILFKKDLKDIDIAVKGDIDLLYAAFAKHFKYKLFYLDEQRKIIRVVAAGLQPAQNKIIFDFSLFTLSIQEDLSRRDFTINSMAYDIKNNVLIDPYGGLKDLKNKLIRVNNEFNIMDDPLRILRFFRISEELKFKISPKSLGVIKKHIKLLQNVPKERITEEFFKILKLTNDFKIINYLFKIGVIGEILNIARKYPAVRVNFNKTIKKLTCIFKKYNFNLPNYLNSIISADRTRLDLIKFILIFINVGAPHVVPLQETNILLSNKEVNFDKLIFSESAKIPANLSTFKGLSFKSGKICEKITSKKDMNKFYLFYKKNKNVFIDIVVLLDLIGVKVDNEIIKTYFKFLKNEKTASRLINGDIIKKELGIKEGKHLGRILEKIRKHIITGIITNKKELKSKWGSGIARIAKL